MGFEITCPYCFAKFDHKAVHFRLTTVKNPEYTMDEITAMRDNDPEKEHAYASYRRDHYFIPGESDRYKQWWAAHGQTTEATPAIIKKIQRVEAFELPVVDPSNPEDQGALKRQDNGEYLLYDKEGMAAAVDDIYGQRSFYRVCPFCNNPLALGYGHNPVFFISVVGGTSAGKTVFLSQLIHQMLPNLSSVGFTPGVVDIAANEYINQNKISYDRPMPLPTAAALVNQPIIYELSTLRNGKHVSYSIILYDIAGENCVSMSAVQRFGAFLNHSDGIILLIDPKQVKMVQDDIRTDSVQELESILGVIKSVCSDGVDGGRPRTNENGLSIVPLAVCIPKADRIDPSLLNIRDGLFPSKGPDQGFDARSYNHLQQRLCHDIMENPMLPTSIVANSVRINFANYNYFAFSALGCDVETRIYEGAERSFPQEVPAPVRLAEPFFWLLHTFGLLRSSTPVRLPYIRQHEHVKPNPDRHWYNPWVSKFVPLTEEEERRFHYEA